MRARGISRGLRQRCRPVRGSFAVSVSPAPSLLQAAWYGGLGIAAAITLAFEHAPKWAQLDRRKCFNVGPKRVRRRGPPPGPSGAPRARTLQLLPTESLATSEVFFRGEWWIRSSPDDRQTSTKKRPPIASLLRPCLCFVFLSMCVLGVNSSIG